MPYILYSKKRYAGQMYTNPDKPDKIDIKGLQVCLSAPVPVPVSLSVSVSVSVSMCVCV